VSRSMLSAAVLSGVPRAYGCLANLPGRPVGGKCPRAMHELAALCGPGVPFRENEPRVEHTKVFMTEEEDAMRGGSASFARAASGAGGAAFAGRRRDERAGDPERLRPSRSPPTVGREIQNGRDRAARLRRSAGGRHGPAGGTGAHRRRRREADCIGPIDSLMKKGGASRINPRPGRTTRPSAPDFRPRRAGQPAGERPGTPLCTAYWAPHTKSQAVIDLAHVRRSATRV
jgi:hypothetical protein